MYRADFFVALAGINNKDNYRIGVTASKRIGNAVVRNFCKRRIRAMSQQLLSVLGKDGVDYVFIAKKRLVSAKWDDFLSEAKNAIEFLNKKVEKCKSS